MMRLTAVCAAVVLTACASGPAPQSSAGVRTGAPVNYEATVASYFDLTVPDPRNERKLVFGPPEASPCAMHGAAGAHLGWVVPVVYDTTPSPARSNVSKAGTPAPSTPVAAAAKAGTTKSAAATKSGGKANGKATAQAKAPADPPAATSTSGTGSSTVDAGPLTLTEVSISGTRFFFWFSGDTLSAVTRRVDQCP